MRTGRDAVEDDAMTWWTGTKQSVRMTHHLHALYVSETDKQTPIVLASMIDQSFFVIYERDEYAVQHRLGRRQAIWLICLLRLPVLLHTSGLSQPRLPGMTTRLCAPEFS